MERFKRNDLETLSQALVLLDGEVTTSTGGDIDSADCMGFSIEKVADQVGRYEITINVEGGYVFRGIDVSVHSAATPYSADKGLCAFVVGWYPETGKAYLQFCVPAPSVTVESEAETTAAGEPLVYTTTVTNTVTAGTEWDDAEVEDGAIFDLVVKLRRRT